MVEPALQTVDGTPAVVVWASLPEDAPLSILSGMTVEAEVVAAEARDTLLVPIQALRELSPGSYAVFLVQADGSLKMTPVEVGLRDFANAEILSGLKVGDMVSTGTVETK
jgi:multidrug efflux pump subunit AcrA (membrane-fusion protein)